MRTLLRFAVSDAALVRQVLDDRPQAFEELALRYQRKAWAVARAHGVPADAVEDVVQEAFLKALRDLRGLRAPDHFGPWFLAIVRNTARQQLRAARRTETSPHAGDEAAPSSPPALEAEELRQHVRRKVEALPDDVREAVYLYYFEGRSTRAAAKALGVSVGTVHNRLERGREILRRELWRQFTESLEASLPPRAEWRRKARLLTLLLLAATPPAMVAGAAGAAGATVAAGAATTVAKGAFVAKTVHGGLIVSAKKIALAAALAACALAGGLILVVRPSGDPAPTRVAGRDKADREAAARAAVETSRRRAAPRDPDSRPSAPAELRPGGATELGRPSLAGTVRGADGAPLAGVRVFAVELARWSGVRVGVKLANSLEAARDLVKLREAYLREAKNVAEAQTDAAGEYRFAALASGEHRVIASHPSHLASFENFAAVDAAGGAHCDIELAEAASISGRVVGEDGAALAGAVVEAEAVEERAKPGRERADAIAAAWEEGRILLAPARAETQSDGSFRITPLEPGTYALTCRKSGYAPSSMPMVPAGTADAVLTLQRGGAVAGRVLAPDRTPLRGAAVVLRAAPSTEVHRVFNYQEVDLSVLDAKPMETRSAEDGSFRLEGVPEGSYELAVSAVGFARLERDLEISGAREDLGDLVVATASVISGLVVGPGGQPLEGAVVRADAPRGRIRRSNVLSRTEPEALIEARSGPDGRFELGGLALGRYDVTAALEGLARATATAVETGEQDLRLALSSGISVCGRVVDDVTDKPVAGAELEVGYGKPITVTSDARGEFVVRGLAFSTLNRPVLRIFARHPDYDLFTDFDTPALGRDQDSPVEVRMGRSERISGEILDAEGAPVAGARVHVEVIGLSPDALGYNPAREVRGESGDDGSFTMPAPSHLRSMIGDIRFVVVARHTRRGAGRSEPLGLPESGKPWPEVRIVLSRGAELSGKVTDSAGKPIAGAAVRVRPSWQAAAGGDSTAGERRSFSKRDGTYTLAGIEAGPFVATAAALGYAAEWVEGRADGEGRIEQHFVLERGAVIAGRVVDAAGLPVAGAEVVAFPAGSFEGEGFADSSEFSLRMHRLHGLGAGAAPSRADGSFRIDGLADGRYLVVARREGYEAAEARGVQAGGVAPDLVLARFSALRGRVLAADTRAPVRAFSVDLVNRKKLAERREEGSFHDYRIASEGEVYFEDYEGRFTYDGLRPGDYELLVKAEGCVHSRLDVAVRAGEVNEVEAALERGARIEGVVVDEETRLAVAGAQVSAQRHREGLPEILDWTSTLSGDDGAFVLAGLREGKYTVGVVHPYYAFASVPSKVEVAAAESSTVPRLEVKLRPAGRVEGRIRGLLSSGAKRTVTQRFDLRRQDATAEPDFFQRVYADPQGRFRAESVPVGTYTVVLIEQEMERGKMTHLGPMGGYQTMKPLGAEKETVLGEVEVAARRTARFNAAVPGR